MNFKKSSLVVTALLCGCLLGGCHNKQHDTSDKQGVSTKSGVQFAGPGKKTDLDQTQTTERLLHLNDLVKDEVGKMPLPTQLTIPAGQTVNVSAKKIGKSSVVRYYIMPEALSFNDPHLNNEMPVLALVSKTYDTVDAATKSLHYLGPDINKQLKQISLGHNITGGMQTDKKEQLIHWNQGTNNQWSMLISGKGDKAVSFGKDVVDELQDYQLPATKPYGVAQFSNKSTIIMWQKDKVIYQAIGSSPQLVLSAIQKLK